MLKRWAALRPGIRLLVGIAVTVVALAIVWALFVPLADWLARHDVGSAAGSLHETALDNARGRLLTLGAGLFAAGALVFTARNFTLSRRTFELTEQGQVTDRYTKATEQLGSDKMDVRIGGIYALERVASDSPRDHPTVMEVLTAFIRENSREQWPADPKEGRWTRPDVQAALTVVGRRDVARDIRPIDLFAVNLIQTDLNGADLSGAHLSGAYLDGTGLRGANLSGVRLNRATIQGAHLGGANLRGAALLGATLTGGNFTDADFTDATLTGATFTKADLTRARWPSAAPVPKGWRLDPDSGRLERADAGSRSAEAN